MKYFSNFLALLIGCLISLILLGFLEFLCWFNLNHKLISFKFPEPAYMYEPEGSFEGIDLSFLKNVVPVENDANDFYSPSDHAEAYHNFKCYPDISENIRFWIGKKNCSSEITLRKKISKRLVYHATYSFNENYLRVVPDSNKNAKQTALFLGCSFTFGEGVNDNETFANLIAKKEKNLESIMIATPGMGPHHLLYILEHPNDPRIAKIKNRDGVAVYTMISEHIDRAFNTSFRQRNSKNTSDDPFYDLVEEKIVYAGSFKEVRPYYSIMNFFSNTNFFKQFNIMLPPRGNEQYHHYAAMFSRIKELIFERTGIRQFVISIFPENRAAMPKVLYEELIKKDIPVINFSNYDVGKISGGTNRILGDGHPSVIGHRLYSELLDRELKKRNFIKN